MRRLRLILGLIAISMVAATLPAGADPKGEPIALECEGVPGGTITDSASNGPWTPGFATASTGVYIPYGFEFNASFTPEGGEPIVFPPEVIMKKAPKNTKSHLHGVCTFGGEEEFDHPEFGPGLFQFEGIAYVFWTGK